MCSKLCKWLLQWQNVLSLYSSVYDCTTEAMPKYYHGMKVDVMHVLIRELVDSLCRDGADTPIVRVHWKAFLTRECSRFKPFSYANGLFNCFSTQ